MKITFYHWGYQCPIIHETIALLNRYKALMTIEIIDFTDNEDICRENRIYFPFLTIFDDKQRWFRPLDSETIEKYLHGHVLMEKPYIQNWSRVLFEGTTQPLSVDNIARIHKGCTLTGCQDSCNKKADFLKGFGQETFGVIHLDGDEVVGGAEYLPSLNVPYNIPKDKETAFLTCLYHSSPDYDYKAVPLSALETTLSKSFNAIIAITDAVGSFPNGDLKWFIDNGYADLGVISQEDGYCMLHLVKKHFKV